MVPQQSAGYVFNRREKLGEVFLTNQQLHSTMAELAKRFTCGNYNMFSFNCNHFSDELVAMLLGSRLPRWIFRMTSFLKYLCFCLPKRVVSGQWTLELTKKKKKEDALLKTERSLV